MKKYLFYSKKTFAITTFFIAVDSILTTIFAFVIKELVDVSINKNLIKFFHICIFTIIYVLLMTLTGYLRKLFMAKFTKGSMTNLKNDVFYKLMERNKLNFNDENTGGYISIITNDVEMLQNNYFLNFLMLIQTIISFLTAVIGMFTLNIYIAIGVLCLSFLPVTMPYIFTNMLSRYKKDYSDSVSKFMAKTKDIFSGFEIIKSFNIEKRIYNEYEKANSNVENCRCKFSAFDAFVDAATEFFSFFTYITALIIGTFLVIKNKCTIGTFVAAIQLMNSVNSPILSITRQISAFKSIKLIIAKIENVLNEKSVVDSGIEKKSFTKFIQFSNVSFSYDKNNIAINNISFTLEKGQKYAIVGKSGSGKSTLFKLLLKYYDNFQGNILIDGIDNRDIQTKNLYNLISIIQQDVFMFDANIKDNITLFEKYSDKEIHNALIRSGLNSLKDKLDTHVGENGGNLSGGEKQRIAIARALIRNTPILVLDEATAALDNQTAYYIEKSILDLDKLTILTITHKLSKELLKKYDKIIVIKGGVVVEIGCFDELIKNKNYFYNLYTIET